MLRQVDMRGDDHHLPLHTQLVAGAGIFSALAFLATVPIIHRDIKPANMLIVVSQQRELVKALVADFGEAKQLNQTMNMRSVAGTPVYMAPENREGEAAKSPKMDVFSAGVVVVEMSSGVLPNPGPEMRQRMAVPEEERRALDMAAVRQREILAIARQCIVDDPEERASAQHIMTQYVEALHDAQRRAPITVRSLRARLAALVFSNQTGPVCCSYM
jgi:serine/threonine protein kinase